MRQPHPGEFCCTAESYAEAWAPDGKHLRHFLICDGYCIGHR